MEIQFNDPNQIEAVPVFFFQERFDPAQLRRDGADDDVVVQPGRHASLFDIPNAKPVDHTGEYTTAELIVQHLGDRVPLITAGLVRTPGDRANCL